MLLPKSTADLGVLISASWRPASPAVVEVSTEIKEGARDWLSGSPSLKVKVVCDFSLRWQWSQGLGLGSEEVDDVNVKYVHKVP